MKARISMPTTIGSRMNSSSGHRTIHELMSAFVSSAVSTGGSASGSTMIVMMVSTGTIATL